MEKRYWAVADPRPWARSRSSTYNACHPAQKTLRPDVVELWIGVSGRKVDVSIVAAIFERDSCVIAKRLSDVEDAIIRRTRELYQETGAAVETERDALDDAKYAVEALRVALEQHTRAA